ncbi:tRNA guanosine(34) transglycosylase Tgt [Candidatus Daviesbacteria bacterium]|nr:tRNA guanosine(34) transglycosylase Tgt [Candidatus Daviesbacteria bacterium]
MSSSFKVLGKDKNARAGVLKTAHGEVKTPVFMPIGTQGSVKALSPDDLKEAGAQVILGNTYHLYLRPGSKVIKKMGGLHKFMNWDRPILTDSGGFQVFSLGAAISHGVKKVGPKVYREKDKKIIRRVTVEVLNKKPKLAVNEGDSRTVLSKITEAGVEFKSHIDGSKHLLTPEKSIQVQLDLGSDIVLVLDELLSPLHDKTYVGQSLERTHRWEQRSYQYFIKNLKRGINPKAQIFGILQGVDDQEIRQNEAKWIAKQSYDGVSIGGSFGTSEYWGDEKLNWANSTSIDRTMEWITPLLPENWPRHALGIGEIVDLFLCIERGVDMFDCVAPTRRARNGSLYISPENGGRLGNKFTLSIQRAQFATDKKPIDPGCLCYACQNFSRAYLRHLYISSELLYHRLASIHNVYLVLNLVDRIRQSILDNQFAKLKKKWLD